MPALDVGYVDHGCSIEVRADLYQGWDRGPRTYAFRRETKLDYAGGIVLRVQLQVYPRPTGLGPLQQTFPAELTRSGIDPIPFTVSRRKLVLKIPLIRGGVNQELPWDLTSTGKLGFWWNDINIGTVGLMFYTAQILVVVQTPSSSRVPIDWVRSEKGVSYGQFESNRRRH